MVAASMLSFNQHSVMNAKKTPFTLIVTSRSSTLDNDLAFDKIKVSF